MNTYCEFEIVAAEDPSFCDKSNQGWQKTINKADEKESIQYECFFALERITDAIERLSRLLNNVIFAQFVIFFFWIKEKVVIISRAFAYIDTRSQFRIILEDVELTIPV